MNIWWSGPKGGMGNRLLAIAAARACSDGCNTFYHWNENPQCPGKYEDILKPIANLSQRAHPEEGWRHIETSGWDPIDIYEKFAAALDLSMSLEEFCERLVASIQGLPFQDDLVDAALAWRTRQGQSELVGIHIRRSDRVSHHRKAFESRKDSRVYKNRELPLHQAVLYGVAPPGTIKAAENLALYSVLTRYRLSRKPFRMTVFSDVNHETRSFLRLRRAFGFSQSQIAHPPVEPEYRGGPSIGKRRETSLRDAALEMLCLSRCDAIVQNNRASTFSLVAAIVGSTPILTSKTQHGFWGAIEDSTGRSPVDPVRP